MLNQGINPEEMGILSKIFSSKAPSQIMDFFLDHKEFDYSPAEIALKTGLSFKTITREIPSLEKFHFIKKSRRIGKTTMYILNSDLPAIKTLERFTLEMSEYANVEVIEQDLNPKEEQDKMSSRLIESN
jgi:hypothetical protein